MKVSGGWLGSVFGVSMVGGETLQGKKVDGVGEFSKVRASEKKNQTIVPYNKQFFVQKTRNYFPKKKKMKTRKKY